MKRSTVPHGSDRGSVSQTGRVERNHSGSRTQNGASVEGGMRLDAFDGESRALVLRHAKEATAPLHSARTHEQLDLLLCFHCRGGTGSLVEV